MIEAEAEAETAPRPASPRRRRLATIAAILSVAALARAWELGRLSLWYDEVVTMRLARSSGPGELLRLLSAIDATRAPLHPLLLQGWLRVFGASDTAGRSFSVVCGVLTVALIARLGRRLFDSEASGLWAASLAAISPLTIVYAREARMYAWLALIATIAWQALVSLRPGASAWRRVGYGLSLVALGYSHPLGLLMAAALGLAALLNRRALGLSGTAWLAVHLGAGLLIAPWVGNYLDHEPESTVGRLPVRFLLGLPIGYLGGNFATLAVFAVAIGVGLLRVAQDGRGLKVEHPFAASCLLIWLTVPPVLLYVYSRLAHPVFGPERYTLYVGPAYLLLLGHGLTRLPKGPRCAVAALAIGLAVWTLPARAYAPDLKADWRAAAAYLRRVDPGASDAVVVVSGDPAHNVEVVTARSYLEPARPVLAFPEPPELHSLQRALPPGTRRAWLAVGVRMGRPARTLPDALTAGAAVDLPGLRLRLVAIPET